MAKITNALVSVSDKTGIVDFARKLAALYIHILSTGGTARLLRDSGVPVQEVSEYTGFPEILDGRVKTLHPKVHGALLAVRDKPEHQQQLAEHGINPIDMVVVNLYPFEHTILKPNVELGDAIENIDIGGPTMIRAAAKNYLYVAVVTNPEMYGRIGAELESSDARLGEETHFQLAVEAFRHTAHYDRVIANYLSNLEEKAEYPAVYVAEAQLKQALRYGENRHQSAAFYTEEVREACVGTATQIHGPELSFNNILDANAAIELAKEFDQPAAIVIKHTNPCGAAVANTLHDAYVKAYEGDPVSAFGCVIGLNRPLDVLTAEAIATHRARSDTGKTPYFVEVIIAPEVEDGAIETIVKQANWGARTRILRTGSLGASGLDETARDVRRVVGGYLVQSRDLLGWDAAAVRTVTKRGPTEQELRDLRFAWLCCKNAKSNAIVLVKGESLVGLGAGQTSRVDASIIAVRKAGDRAAGSVLASDAFFPFPDSVEQAAAAGVTAIVQPGGAQNDADVIAAANQYDVAMVLTDVRHFKH